MVRVCFVCLGNICRSPTAEGVMRSLIKEAGLDAKITVESAGTGDWHVGEPPDERTRRSARGRGLVLEGSARQFVAADFERFDYVVAMDRTNLKALRRIAPAAHASKLTLARSFEGAPDSDVPDPYYGGDDGFDAVFDMCGRLCRGLLERIRSDHQI